MSITPLSTQPNSVTRPSTFNTDSDTYHAELPVAITEFNATGAQATADAATATAKAVLTAADRVQTGLDAVATAADRVQTGLDRTAASNSAASAAALAGAFVGTSTTSLLIGSGSKVFTTQAGEQYTDGIFMTAVSAANSANWMFGQVTYSGTTLTMTSTLTGGSGTFADWNLSITGPVGPTGTGITAQAVGFTLTGGTTSKTLTVSETGTAALLGANIFTAPQTLSSTAINEARSSVAQHATTMDFWAAAVGNVLDGTGAGVTITAIANAPQAGASRDFYPLTGTILTQGATFDIDGAVTRTSAAGEVWTFVAKSASTYRVFVRKADGTAVVAGVASALVLLSTVTASVAATVDIETGFGATYDNYIIFASGLTGSVAAVATVLCNLKIGGAYITAGCNGTLLYSTPGATSVTLNNSSNLAASAIGVVSGGANEAAGMKLELFDVNSTKLKAVTATGFAALLGTASFGSIVSGATCDTAGVLSGIRFTRNGGGNLSGVFKLYGIANS